MYFPKVEIRLDLEEKCLLGLEVALGDSIDQILLEDLLGQWVVLMDLEECKVTVWVVIRLTPKLRNTVSCTTKCLDISATLVKNSFVTTALSWDLTIPSCIEFHLLMNRLEQDLI